MTEREVLHAVRAALVGTGCLLLWRNNTGGELVEGGDASTRRRFVHYGLGKGSPDLVGMLRVNGRFVGFEVKRPGEGPTKDQQLWHAVARKAGAFVAVVHSVDEALDALKRAIAGDVS